MRLLFLLSFFAVSGCTADDDARQPLPEGVSPLAASGGINAPAQRDKATVILISIDGFRWDYAELFDTPTLDRLAEGGVRAEAMVPVFPTLTFPNHYSIATGLYPGNHGIVANTFPSRDGTRWYNYRQRETVQDGSWYGGEPVWVAAERNGMVSAAFFFVGTEADIGGVEASYWRPFDYGVSGNDRVDQVLEWLAMPEDTRPHLVTMYFEDVDVASHSHGPESAENRYAVAQIDAYLKRLMQGVAALPVGDSVYFVIVSDHGQSAYKESEKPFVLSDHVNLEGISIVDGGSMSFLYFDRPDKERAARIRDDINESWQHGRAWLREEAPTEFHVPANSDFPELIVLADPQHAVTSERDPTYALLSGNHGWTPSFEDMHGIFMAAGPRLPKGRRIGRISAVGVYPLLLEILELPPNPSIDGDPEKLLPLLQ